MPLLFKSIANPIYPETEIVQWTYDGASLAMHLNNMVPKESKTDLLSMIQMNGYDYVIVQESPDHYLKPIESIETIKNIITIDSLCQLSNSTLIVWSPYVPDTYPVRYCSVIRKKSEVKCSDTFSSYGEISKAYSSFFNKFPSNTNFSIAEFGDVFNMSSILYPKVDLFADDTDYHPSKFGSNLIAANLVRMCFDVKEGYKFKFENRKLTKIGNEIIRKLHSNCIDK